MFKPKPICEILNFAILLAIVIAYCVVRAISGDKDDAYFAN
jgi:hypothetical protein